MDSTSILSELIAKQQIQLRAGSIFSKVPPPISRDELRRDGRIEGIIVGLAVGDALGHSTEWRYDAQQRNAEFGTIVDHVGTLLAPGGRISDDTQLSLWTLERLLATGTLDLPDLVSTFVARRHQIVGAGRNTTGALTRHQERLATGSPAFHQCAGDPTIEGRGNGALMRFTPLVLPHLASPSPKLWSDVALASFITHGHTAALSSVVTFAHLMWEILRRPTGSAPEPEWWLDEYVTVAEGLETMPLPNPLGKDPVPAMFRDYRGTLCEFIDTKVRRAWRSGMSFRDACSLKGFGSGADVAQSALAVLYALMSHADSFESAVIAAVNDTKDNDTIASIVGGILGALHGRRAIRARWFSGIRSRNLAVGGNLNGDDRTLIERLASEAAQRFGPPAFPEA